jgi:hypothetical protein
MCIHTHTECNFSKENRFWNAVTQNSVTEVEVLVILMPRKKGSRTPFQPASFWERTSGMALQCVPSQKYPCTYMQTGTARKCYNTHSRVAAIF